MEKFCRNFAKIVTKCGRNFEKSFKYFFCRTLGNIFNWVVEEILEGKLIKRRRNQKILGNNFRETS